MKKVFFQFQKIAWCSAMTSRLLQNKLKEKKSSDLNQIL